MADLAHTSHQDAASRRSRRYALLLLALLTALFPCSAYAADPSLITIQSKIWGFDGRVHAGQFNPVSFLIDNRTDEAIDAVASLHRTDGIVGTTGGRYEQQVFIGPGAQRWVQLYPYIATDDQAEWILTLGEQEFRGQQQPRATNAIGVSTKKEKRPKPRPAMVILDAPGAMSLKPVTVKHFPESIFPPWGTATVGLHAIFMDHAPDWETPRQEALMSWLRRGGQLHLLKNSRGTRPVFTGALADLNQPFNSFTIGSGQVTRHDFQRGDVSDALVRSISNISPDKPDELTNAELTANAGQYGTPSMYNTTDSSWLDETWFDAMRLFTQPDHPWWLIFLLALIYIGAIFPGCWLLARQNRHYLIVYGSIAGLSIVFSLLFLVIGRRGYGEFTTQQTLAISRVEDNTTQNVMEWNALFVTSGDQYEVTGKNQEAMFAIPGLRQQSSAVITSGNDGQLSVGIPPFSTQTFISRRRLPLADWQLELVSLQPGTAGISNLELQCGPNFAVDDDAQLRLLYRRNLYRVSLEDDTRRLVQTGRLGSLAKICNEYYQNNYGTFGWGYQDDTIDAFYDKVLPGLILRSLADDGIYDPRDLDLPPDRIRLYVYTRLPQDHFVETSTDSRKNGRVLYVRDIALRPNMTSAISQR